MSLSKENKVIIDGQTYHGGVNQPNLKFVKVNADCWDRILDFLPFYDVLAMSQTCLRMRQIVGNYFRENFHGTACDLDEMPSPYIFVAGCRLDREHFLRFIDTICIQGGIYLESLRFVSKMNLLSSLTTLELHCVDLDEHQLLGLEKIQTNIETIELRRCDIRYT